MKKKCKKCDGSGIMPEHDMKNCACYDFSNPAVTCPVPVQCEACRGTGFIIEEEKE